MKKIIITGGAGFIGSAIHAELKKQGHELFVIDNLTFGNRQFIDTDDAHFIKEDIRDREKMKKLFLQIRPQWVIHLAAVHYIPYCNQHPVEAADININGTISVCNATTFCGTAEKFFFASTAAVYPVYDNAVKEDLEPGPVDIYGTTKLTGEYITKVFHNESGIASVVCRFFNAFGPNETNAHVIPEVQRQVNEGLREIKLGNLEPKRDFIHTYDMARAVSMLLSSEIKGCEVFNLGRGIEYSITEIVDAFSKEVGEKIKIIQDPERMRKTDRMHLLADVSKLTAFTGWKPQWSLEDGVKTLVNHANK
ncbi:MAG: NAD-dependent epimerase/dehydratase family protein [Bacteroidota bacterium]